MKARGREAGWRKMAFPRHRFVKNRVKAFEANMDVRNRKDRSGDNEQYFTDVSWP
jgi:hypothetical protein